MIRPPGPEPATLGEVDAELLRDPTNDRRRLHTRRIRDRQSAAVCEATAAVRRIVHGHLVAG